MVQDRGVASAVAQRRAVEDEAVTRNGDAIGVVATRLDDVAEGQLRRAAARHVACLRRGAADLQPEQRRAGDDELFAEGDSEGDGVAGIQQTVAGA